MNQILVSQRMYVTKEMKRKTRIYKAIYISSIILIIVLLIYFVFEEKNKNEQEAVSQMILSQIEDTTTVTTDVIVIALNDNEEEIQEEPPEEIVVEEQTSDEPVTMDIMGYKTEGVLDYPKLGISYPILAEENESLLKISLCKYWGPEANNVGNYCIVGHNYRSGKMFGYLSQAETGDEVKLTDLTGKTVKYSVYNKYVVEPTDVSCTSQLTNGKREITLITCTNYGKQRLVVKAREI